MSRGNDRLVLGVEAIDQADLVGQRFSTSIYHGDRFKISLSRAMDYLSEYKGLIGQRPFFVYHGKKSSADRFLEIFSAMTEAESKNLRIVLSDIPVDASHLSTDNKKALFLIVGGETASFEQSKAVPTNFRAQLPTQLAHLFILDYFSEIYIANAAYPVQQFLVSSRGDLAHLYRQKNALSQDGVASFPDRFGVDRASVDYSCFVNASRCTSSYFDRNALDHAVDAWDRMILNRKFGLTPSKEQTLSAVRRWPRVGGQINISKVARQYEMLRPGAYLLAIQKRATSLRQTRQNFERVRGLLRADMPRRANLFKAFRFIPAEMADPDLAWAIDSNFIQVMRIWKGE